MFRRSPHERWLLGHAVATQRRIVPSVVVDGGAQVDLPGRVAVGDLGHGSMQQSRPDEYETAWHAQSEPDNLTAAPTGGR